MAHRIIETCKYYTCLFYLFVGLGREYALALGARGAKVIGMYILYNRLYYISLTLTVRGSTLVIRI